MVIKLYQCTSDPKSINKTLDNEKDVSGVARDPVDVINPVIDIEHTGLSIAGYNYAYIEDYARYYFMEVKPDSYDMATIRLHCDVLKTAASWLRARSATITRNEALYNSYLNDPDFKSYAYTNIVTKAFPQGVSGDSIILMTVG